MSWLGTALSYFTGGLSGAYNSYMQNESISDQIAAQAEENQKNRDFSKQMYEQQWADYLKNYPELMQMENDAQFNLWKNQFATQSAYNSENAQVARSLVAGLNPSKNGLIQGSNMNMQPSTVQAPPHIQGSPLGGSISPTGIPDLLPANLLSQAAAFAKDLSQVDINKKQLDKMTSEIDKILAEKDLIDSQRSFQEIKNGIYQVLGYKKETVEIINMVKQSYMYEAQGNSAAAAAEMHKAQGLLFDSERVLNEEKRPFVGKIMQSEIDRNQSEVRRNNALAFEASERGKIQVSIGAYYQAMADTENALRDGRTTALELSNDISTISKYIAANELKYSDNTLEARCKMVAEGLRQQELITQQQYEKLQQEIVATKWAERNQFRDYCLAFLNGTANVLGAASGFYNGSINRMNQEDKNRIQQDFNDVIRNDSEFRNRNSQDYNNILRDKGSNPSYRANGYGYTPDWQR